MGTAGKQIISDEIKKIREEIEQYYGELNELKMGARGKPPKKPDSLLMYEIVKDTGLPILSGGYIDQPYLLTLYFSVIKNTVETMEYLANLATNANNAN